MYKSENTESNNDIKCNVNTEKVTIKIIVRVRKGGDICPGFWRYLEFHEETGKSDFGVIKQYTKTHQNLNYFSEIKD